MNSENKNQAGQGKRKKKGYATQGNRSHPWMQCSGLVLV